jgi:hypothetical protein
MEIDPRPVFFFFRWIVALWEKEKKRKRKTPSANCRNISLGGGGGGGGGGDEKKSKNCHILTEKKSHHFRLGIWLPKLGQDSNQIWLHYLTCSQNLAHFLLWMVGCKSTYLTKLAKHKQTNKQKNTTVGK